MIEELILIFSIGFLLFLVSILLINLRRRNFKLFRPTLKLRRRRFKPTKPSKLGIEELHW